MKQNSQLKGEHTAQTTFRLSPDIFCAPFGVRSRQANHKIVPHFFRSDSSDFSLVETLDVESSFGFESRRPMTVALELTDDHLFANVKTSALHRAHLVST